MEHPVNDPRPVPPQDEKSGQTRVTGTALPLPAGQRLLHPAFLLADLSLVILFGIAALLVVAGTLREAAIVGAAALACLARGTPATRTPRPVDARRIRRVRLLRGGRAESATVGELTALSAARDRVRLSPGYRVPLACRVVEAQGLVVAPPRAPLRTSGTEVQAGETLAAGRMIVAGRGLAEVASPEGRRPRPLRPPRAPQLAVPGDIETTAPLLGTAWRNLALITLAAGAIAALIGALIAARGLLPGREALVLAAGLIALAVPPGLPGQLAKRLAQARAEARRAGLHLFSGGGLEQLARTSFLCLDRQAVLTDRAPEVVAVLAPDAPSGDTERSVLQTAQAAAGAADGVRAERLAAAIDAALASPVTGPSPSPEPVAPGLPGVYAAILREADSSRIAFLGPAETLLSQWPSAWALPASSDAGTEFLAVAEAPLRSEPVQLSPAHAPDGLRILGVIAVTDPVPKGSGTRLRDARAAGIRSALFSEEAVGRVRVLGDQLGLVQVHARIPLGVELRHDPAHVLGHADNIIRPSRLFAETGPGQPHLIAGSYDRDNHRVLLTDLAGERPDAGDIGQSADGGRVLRIAVAGRSDDVALETAHGVLLRPELDSLLGALAAARGGFRAVRTQVQASLGFGFGVLLLAVVLTLAGWPGLPGGAALLTLALLVAVVLGPAGAAPRAAGTLPPGPKRGVQRLWRPSGVRDAALTSVALAAGGALLAKLAPAPGAGVMMLYLATVASGRLLVLEWATGGRTILAAARGLVVLAAVLGAVLWPQAAAMLDLGAPTAPALAAAVGLALLPVGLEAWLCGKARANGA